MNYTEEISVQELKNGDKKAFTWIYNNYFLQLYLYTVKIVEDKEDAEDIVQDIFENLWKDHKTLVISSSLKAYLYGNVRNNSIKKLEHINVRHKHIEYTLHTNNNFNDNNDPLSLLIAEEAATVINKVIDNLPEKCRKVFLMWTDEGLKYDEITEKLGMSIGSVGKQINRARIKIRKALEDLYR